MFYSICPCCVLAFLVCSNALTDTKINRSMRFDVSGFAMLSLAVAALQMFLDRGELKDWFGSTEIVVEAVLAGVFFFVFPVPTVTPDQPLTHPQLLASRTISHHLPFPAVPWGGALAAARTTRA